MVARGWLLEVALLLGLVLLAVGEEDTGAEPRIFAHANGSVIVSLDEGSGDGAAIADFVVNGQPVLSSVMQLQQSVVSLQAEVVRQQETRAALTSSMKALCAATDYLQPILYYATENGVLVAMSLDTTVLWDFDTGTGQRIPAVTVGPDATIYFGSYPHFFALAPDGSVKWRLTTNGDVSSKVTFASDGTLFFGNLANSLYIVHPNGTVLHRVPTTANVHSTGVLSRDEQVVFFPNLAGTVHAVNVSSGEILWSYDSEGDINLYDISVGPDDTVYFGGNSGNLTALRPDGTLKWQSVYGAQVSHSVITADGNIVVGGLLTLIKAYTPEGEELWSQQVNMQFVRPFTVSPDGTIYIAPHSRQMYAISPAGQELWRSEITGVNQFFSASPRLGRDGSLYLVTTGDIYRVNAANGEFINQLTRPQQYRRAFAFAMNIEPPVCSALL